MNSPKLHLQKVGITLIVLLLCSGCHRDKSPEKDAARHMRDARRLRHSDRVTFDPAKRTLRLERDGVKSSLAPRANAADVGVAFYPGVVPNGTQHSLKEDEKGVIREMYFVNMKTPDSLDKIAKFYRKQLGDAATFRDFRPLGRKLITFGYDQKNFNAAITARTVGDATEITIISRKIKTK